MNDIIIKESGGSYSAIPDGSYRAVCYSIVCIGTQYSELYGNEQKKLIITWELPDERTEVDGESRPRTISDTYTVSLNEKATLRKMLESWRGKAFTSEELNGFSLNKLLGVPCLLTIMQKPKNGGGYFTKIAGVSRLPAIMEAPKGAENELICFDVCNENHNLKDVVRLPEWVQNKIFESTEFKKRTNKEEGNTTPVAVDGDLPF